MTSETPRTPPEPGREPDKERAEQGENNDRRDHHVVHVLGIAQHPVDAAANGENRPSGECEGSPRGGCKPVSPHEAILRCEWYGLRSGERLREPREHPRQSSSPSAFDPASA